MNPWPVAIRLVLGLAVIVAGVIAMNRYAAGPRSEPARDVRVAVFHEVYEDLENGTARLLKWRDVSGRTVFPGIAEGDCRPWRDAAARDRPINDPTSSAEPRQPPPAEATLLYVRAYNQTLRDLLRSRQGDCGMPPPAGNGGV